MMTDILSTEDYELCSKLKAMRFSGMAEALEELLRDPNSDLIPFREKVGRLVDAEWDLRYNKKLNRFIKKATLKYPHADLDETIYDPERLLDTRIIEELSKCKWVEQGRNLFEVLESRDPGRSTMVISQFPVNTWYDLFQEHTYADACLNRLLHNSYRLEMNGKNMRDLTPLNK